MAYELSQLTFEEPDLKRFPQLAYAYEALAAGGTASIVLNAANEVAVEAFLAERLSFTGIAEVCRRTMDALSGARAPVSVEEILASDSEARYCAAKELTNLS